MTSSKPCKSAWPLESAYALIRENSGSHVDPRLVEVFFDILPQVLDVRSRYAEPDGASDQASAYA